MRITWRDLITTLTTIGAIVLERAYALNWNWPFVSEITWAVIGIAVLAAIGLLVNFAPDDMGEMSWTWVFGILTLTLAALTILGLYFEKDYYVSLITVNAIAIWVTSIAHTFMTTSRNTHIEA